MIYRKLPILIEAYQVNADNYGSLLMISEIEAGIELWDDSATADHDYKMQIPTQNGLVIAHMGDYVCRDIQGKLYPCNQAVFEATHEQVKENL